ncbi:MAG: hypothetical protein ACJ79S_13990 [Gemmatimonadaceae bacterium]
MLTALVVAQLAVTLHAPDTVALRTPGTVVVEASAPGAELPRITAPTGAAFQLVLTGASSRVTGTLGSRWNTVEQQYQLLARRVGPFTLPPFEVTTVTAATRTKPHRVLVRPANALLGAVPPVIAGARLDADDEGVSLRAVVLPDTVYVGQQTTYQVGVFLDDDVRLRLRRNPEFVPPEPRGMLAYELPSPPASPPARAAGGRRFEAHVFQRALFPLGAGRFVVPTAQLVYSLPLSSSFFSREESHTVRSDSLVVVAVEPPATGRPADWAGAVGDLSVDARLDSSTGRAGDPIVVTVRVQGRGNVKLLPRPSLTVPWGTAVPSEERVELDTQSVVVRGVKEFDWLVTPRQAGTLELPRVRYPYFNPYTERYEIAVTPPRPVTVSPGALAALDSARAATPPPLPLRPALRAPVGPPAHERPAFWAVALLAPLPAAAAGFARRPRRRRAPPSPRDVLRSLARRPGPVDAARLRRAYAGALATRLHLTPGAITTTRGALARALRRSGTTSETAAQAEALLVALDRAAYSPGTPPPAGAAASALDLYARVDAEARSRLALAARRLAPAVVLAATLGGALAGSTTAIAAALDADAPAPAERFAAGRAAYDDRRFADAARIFADVAREQPRAADAWANFGTASWAAADTAAAVVGWQRALRLEPLAGDARERLALVGPSQQGAIATVPRIPLDAATVAALVVWCGGWALLLLAARRRRARATLSAWGAAALATSLALTVAARGLASACAAHGLAVVEDRGPLRALPALSADQGAALVPGDVARILSREGAWARVALDGEREGWIEWERLVPLAE